MDSTIRWGTTHAQPVLMIPGPTELPFPVVQALNQPATIQYDMNFDVNVLEPVTLALRDIFQTRGEVLVMPGSGRTALEASAISAIEPGERVLVVEAGAFGALMREIMIRAGAEVTEHAVEWGRPLDLARLEQDVERVKPKAVTMVHNETSTGTTYPAAEVGRIAKRHGALFILDTVSSLAGLDVRTDEWGVDFNMTGSQKCLAAPLGMADEGLHLPVGRRKIDREFAHLVAPSAGCGFASACSTLKTSSDPDRDLSSDHPFTSSLPRSRLPRARR